MNLQFLGIILSFICLAEGQNKRQTAAEEVKRYLDDVNLEVDREDSPKSNSSRDYLEPGDIIKAEFNDNPFNEIQSQIQNNDYL
jgi:hypothetical protein